MITLDVLFAYAAMKPIDVHERVIQLVARKLLKAIVYTCKDLWRQRI